MSTNGHGDDSELGVGRAAEEDRRLKFKNAGKTKEELRRRRVEDNVELRKAKREDTMMKRRNVDLDALASSPESPPQEYTPHVDPAEEVAAAGAGLMSNVEKDVFENLTRLRKILSREQNPPIDLVIRAGYLNKLVLLMQHPNEKMQFEAAWAVTNIASGTSAHTTAVIQAGAVPILLHLFANSPHVDVAEQALWGMGNVVGDGPNNRDAVLEAGIVPMILIHLNKPDIPRSFVKNIAWMISNLTRGKNPMPNFNIIRPLIPALSNLLDAKDLDTVVDSLWSLSYMSDGGDDQVDAVIEAGIVPKVVRILGNTRDVRPLTPCVRILGNIVTGTDAQTDVCIKAGVLDVVVPVLDLPKSNLVKEACWLLSNVAAGNHDQIEAVLESGCMHKINSIMRHGEYRCQKEAAWVITNMLAGGTARQLQVLFQLDIIPPLCELLKSQDAKFVAVILDALLTLLQAASKASYVDKITEAIEECGGLDVLEHMQNHENEDLYRKSYAVIEGYFQTEEEAEVEEIGEGDGQFTF